MRFNGPFFVIGCAAATSSCLLFFFQGEIANVVRSSDICDAHAYSILQWVFPKVIFRCRLLSDPTLLGHSGLNIMIILDIWIALCCILSLIFSVWKLQSITENDLFDYLVILREGERKAYAKASARFRVRSSVYFLIKMQMRLHAFVFVFTLGLVFVFSPAVGDGTRLDFASLLASYGTGVLVHGIGSVIPAVCLFYSILSYRLLRAFSLGNIK